MGAIYSAYAADGGFLGFIKERDLNRKDYFIPAYKKLKGFDLSETFMLKRDKIDNVETARGRDQVVAVEFTPANFVPVGKCPKCKMGITVSETVLKEKFPSIEVTCHGCGETLNIQTSNVWRG